MQAQLCYVYYCRYKTESEGKVHRLIISNADESDVMEYSATFQILVTKAKLTSQSKNRNLVLAHAASFKLYKASPNDYKTMNVNYLSTHGCIF